MITPEYECHNGIVIKLVHDRLVIRSLGQLLGRFTSDESIALIALCQAVLKEKRSGQSFIPGLRLSVIARGFNELTDNYLSDITLAINSKPRPYTAMVPLHFIGKLEEYLEEALGDDEYVCALARYGGFNDHGVLKINKNKNQRWLHGADGSKRPLAEF